MLKDSPLRKEKKLEHYQLLRIQQKLNDEKKTKATQELENEDSNILGMAASSIQSVQDALSRPQTSRQENGNIEGQKYNFNQENGKNSIFASENISLSKSFSGSKRCSLQGADEEFGEQKDANNTMAQAPEAKRPGTSNYSSLTHGKLKFEKTEQAKGKGILKVSELLSINKNNSHKGTIAESGNNKRSSFNQTMARGFNLSKRNQGIVESQPNRNSASQSGERTFISLLRTGTSLSSNFRATNKRTEQKLAALLQPDSFSLSHKSGTFMQQYNSFKEKPRKKTMEMPTLQNLQNGLALGTQQSYQSIDGLQNALVSQSRLKLGLGIKESHNAYNSCLIDGMSTQQVLAILPPQTSNFKPEKFWEEVQQAKKNSYSSFQSTPKRIQSRVNSEGGNRNLRLIQKRLNSSSCGNRGDQPLGDLKERYNSEYKGRTPSLKDEDIKEMLKRYPADYQFLKEYLEQQSKHVRANTTTDQRLNTSEMNQRKQNSLNNNLDYVLSFESKKQSEKSKIYKIMSCCKKIENEWVKEKKDTEYQQLVQRLKEQEFLSTFDTVRQLEQAQPAVVPILYSYLLNDYNQNLILAEEVAKEFKSGKLDPKMAIKQEKTQKELIKKGKMVY